MGTGRCHIERNEWIDFLTRADCLSSERLSKMPELELQKVVHRCLELWQNVDVKEQVPEAATSLMAVLQSRVLGTLCGRQAAIVLHGLALSSRSLGWPSQAPLGCFMSHVCDFWTIAAVTALSSTRCLVVSGHHSTNSALADLGAAARGHQTRNVLVSHSASTLIVRPM